MKETMIRAAKAAGEILKKYYGTVMAVQTKVEKGIVTQADQEAEATILSILQEKFDYGVIAEESGRNKSDSEYCWVIDPLDGTTNFSLGLEFFCVSIGLLKNNKLEAAVIYQPLTEELFYAQKDQGAFLNGNKLNKIISSYSNVIACNKGYGLEVGEKYLEALKSFLPDYRNTRCLGSSALELAYVATGRMDAFVTYGDELYDVAAGILIAQEAGCEVTNWKGEEWTVDMTDLLVAPKDLHQELVKYLSKI